MGEIPKIVRERHDAWQRGQDVLKRRNSGEKLIDIARDMGLSRGRVDRILKRAESTPMSPIEAYELREKIVRTAVPDDTPLATMPFSQPTRNVLRDQPRLKTVGDIRRLSDAELHRLRNIGRTICGEIRSLCGSVADADRNN
ncbi:MAG: hypothetical protein EOS05_13510 [Mesorhizobium sp.]|nr:MAG: hypothetical protein EOS05_13510 [Mesorhizobium sp.]